MTAVWTVPQVAAALDAPDEAFRAFSHFAGVAWDGKIDIALATRLAIEWHAAGNGGAGPVGDAVAGLNAAMTTALGSPAG